MTVPISLKGEDLFTASGTVDLRLHDFDQKKIVDLNGEWLFAPEADQSRLQPIMVPGSWGRSGLPEQGRGTYILHILLAENAPPMAIRFGYIHSSSVIKVNDQILYQNGVPGDSPSETVPQWAPVFLHLPSARDGTLLLEIDAANFHHAKGGIPGAVEIGPADVLENRWELNRLLETTLAGLIFWIGVYHFLLYILRRKGSGASLSLAAGSMLFAVRIVLIGDYVLSSFLSEGTWTLFLRLEYICYVLSSYFLILFLSQVYRKDFFRPVVTTYQVVTWAYSLIILVTPTLFFSSLLPIHQYTLMITFLLSAGFLVRAVWNKRLGAGLIFSGMLILILTSLNDVLRYTFVIIPYDMSVPGSAMFLIFNSFGLARIFTRKFSEVEELSINLSKANEELGRSREEIEKKNSELRLLANSDYLTGLPNRMALFESVDKELSRAERSGSKVGVLLVDLDHFKQVNDSYGHTRGDLLLCEISRRMKKILRKGDAIFRLGGDEFTVIIPDLQEPENLIRVAKKIMSILEEPIDLKSVKCVVGTSVGISQFPDDGDTVNALLKNADIALYEAKKQGRGRFICFNRDMQKTAESRFMLINRMPDALAKGEFKLFFQPQMNMKNYSLYGLEALIRWKDPDIGFISPSVFIPLMEETGFINVLGEWILEQVCFSTQPWVKRNPDLLISVNLSSVQFCSPDFLETLDFTLLKTGFPTENLVVELTEGVIMHDSETTLNTLREIRRRGIKVAVDDFGTGYSSLSYLKKFPLDHLKIDQSFISDLFTTHFDKDIVSTIIDLAGILGLEVIAEGIESVKQQEFLETHGCYIMQGYLMGRPDTLDEMEDLLSNKDAVREYLQML